MRAVGSGELRYAVYVAQIGGKHVEAKPVTGLGSGLLEVVSDYRGDTFRAVYTVRFARAVYVLHAFQKKCKKAIATPRREMELVKARMTLAETLHQKQEMRLMADKNGLDCAAHQHRSNLEPMPHTIGVGDDNRRDGRVVEVDAEALGHLLVETAVTTFTHVGHRD